MATTISGDTGASLVLDGSITNAKLNLFANSSQVMTALNASGTAPIFACRAWVNFNGTGTVAIRASGNVSSITDNGTGLYTVNFTTAMSDINYGCSVSASNLASAASGTCVGFANDTGSYSTSAISLRIQTSDGLDVDRDLIAVSVFR